MTNRTSIRPYSAGVTIKRPRLKKLEILFDGPDTTNQPEGLNNGIRPHGGYRGAKPHPPGQFSFNKDETFHDELHDEYQLMLAHDNYETHGAPYWLSDVQREITHSGESPLFTNKLLASGKFEQEHGIIEFERSVLRSNTRRSSAPRRRHLNGKKEYYRPNSTHQYLSATDLRSLSDSEDSIIRYGRPTRTTLLRARQRTGSAPVNAYDIRRETTRRIEDVKSNTIFCTAKEFYNIYATDGETMHSFLTGARYNRAHMLDSKGMSVYGVYMPRENPKDCFIASNRRRKDFGEDIPSAPPDSPRSDYEESPTVPANFSRPPSSRHVQSRPASSSRPGSNRPMTRTPGSRPQSHSKSPQKSSALQSRGTKDQSHPSSAQGMRTLPKTPELSKRDTLPDEITMAMPDHLNRAGKAGVYVTLKGPKMIETVESKLPRVTGVSLPKLRKSRDAVEELSLVNQPPPTPVDVSVTSADRGPIEGLNVDVRHNDDKPRDTVPETENQKTANNVENADKLEIKDNLNVATEQGTNDKSGDYANGEIVDIVNEHVSKSEDVIMASSSEKINTKDDFKATENATIKHVNFSDMDVTIKDEPVDIVKTNSDLDTSELNNDVNRINTAVKKDNDKVVFFMTEEENETPRSATQQGPEQTNTNEADEEIKQDDIEEVVVEQNSKPKIEENSQPEVEQKPEVKQDDIPELNNEIANENDLETAEKSVDDVIKVEISETEKKQENIETTEDNKEALTSAQFPFTSE